MSTPTIKCLVWDLDDTMWDGVLLERDEAIPYPDAVHTLRVLADRGIVHAVASRGDPRLAEAHLRKHGLYEMFATIQVGWGAKSASVRQVASSLNIGMDTIAFVDNDPAERAEVTTVLPQVRVYDAARITELPLLDEFVPGTVTAEARARTELYRVERDRKRAEDVFDGTRQEFLTSLGLVMTVRPAGEEDLERAHELTVRTHQLNTTGRTFDIDELRKLIRSPRHEVLVASLRDRFGSYGVIGLVVSELRGPDSVIELLLMSCRVMSRGVGTPLIRHVVGRARAAGRRPLAEFVPTEVNRVMLVTLRFAGFGVWRRQPDSMVLAFDSTVPSAATDHITVLDQVRSTTESAR